MYSVNNIENIYNIKKSKFITKLYFVNDITEVNNILNKVKAEYSDATHICYAYIIDDLKKSSDDGEPGGTAGVPIMESLNNKELNYILCVVTRYFGGIKLGAGGLVRAYRKATIDAINNSSLLDLVDGYEIKLEVNYNEQKDLEYLIKDNYSKQYTDNVTYIIKCDEDIKKILEAKYKIIEINKIKIER